MTTRKNRYSRFQILLLDELIFFSVTGLLLLYHNAFHVLEKERGRAKFATSFFNIFFDGRKSAYGKW